MAVTSGGGDSGQVTGNNIGNDRSVKQRPREPMTTNEPKFLSHPGAGRTANGPKAGTVGSTDMPTTPDDVLLQRVAAGNRLAMQVLYARHHVRVYRFALRLTGNPATAEDLTSDVFLDVWRQAGRFEGRSAVSTWLLAITRLKAFSMMRRRTEQELDDYTAAAIEDPADDPEVALERKDRSAIIRRCLTELSAEHREMIDLVYYHQKSTQEVADIVGIPVNTVKTRVHYARKRLSALLQAAGIAGVAA
jgi:RNA polymerase sigma-70 factor (ECF subfamily)